MIFLFYKVLLGALIPLAGTTFGALISFVSPRDITEKIGAILSGFAAGVMVAASVWSLLIPAIEYSENYGRFSFIVPCLGIVVGALIMMVSDAYIEKRDYEHERKKENLLYFAVTLHNIPEGMAIGAAYAAYVYTENESQALSALVLSVGIAIQNIPEGAIVSLPYKNVQRNKLRNFLGGVFSGVVEPIAVIITVALSWIIVPMLPFMLSFASGAMLFVVLKELIPEFSDKECFNRGAVAFFFGFMLMMSLDVALG